MDLILCLNPTHCLSLLLKWTVLQILCLNLTHCLSLLLKCLFLGNFVILSGEHFLFLFPLTPFSFVFYVICETASVPDSVKAELLQRIRSFLMSSSLR
jgi:hypothetical protein